MSACSRCRSLWPNPACPVCRAEHDTAREEAEETAAKIERETQP